MDKDNNDDPPTAGVQGLVQKFQTSKFLEQNFPPRKSKPMVAVKPSFYRKSIPSVATSPAPQLKTDILYYPAPAPSGMSSPTGGKALQILHLKEHGFTLDKDAFISVLDKVRDLPVAIVSINGSCREGKSYVLNYFIRYLKFQGCPDWFERELPPEEQFSWRSGRERNTVGINLYSDPFIIQTGTEEVAVLLLDCQGLFDQHTTFEQNAVIYGLSNLLSSVMIYNVKCKIEENLLQNIHYFSSYAKAITSEEVIEEERPHFMFLLRDFEFCPEYELGYHGEDTSNGGTNYYQDTMFPSEDVPKENITTRSDILSCYTNLGTFLMPHPGKPFLQNSALNPPDKDFQNQLRNFVTLMMSPGHLVTKKIGGQRVTAEMLKPYVEIWGEEISSSASEFMRAETIADSTAKLQNEVAAHGVIARFKEEFCQYLCSEHAGVEDDELLQYKDDLLGWAIRTYRGERKLGGEALMQQYVQKIQETCSTMFQDAYLPLNTELRRRNQENQRTSAQYEVSLRANEAHIRKLRLENDTLRNQTTQPTSIKMELEQKLAERRLLEASKEAGHAEIRHFQAKAKPILQREREYFSHLRLENITRTRNRQKKLQMAQQRYQEELREAYEEKELLESEALETYGDGEGRLYSEPYENETFHGTPGTWRPILEDDVGGLSDDESDSRKKLRAANMKILDLSQKLEELKAALEEKKEKGRRKGFWRRLVL